MQYRCMQAYSIITHALDKLKVRVQLNSIDNKDMLSTEHLGKVNGVILRNAVCCNISIIHCHSYTNFIIMIFIITMHNQQITIA